jgi:uncharacterized protein (TIGR02266 family)
MKGPRRTRDRRQTQKPATAERRAQPRRIDTERRADVRVPIDLWMEEVHGDEIYFRRTCNLSEGGVFFDQSIPHPVGTQVHLRFTLPGSDASLEAEGEVVSAARATDGLGMGVKFTRIPPDTKKPLKDIVHALAKKHGAV